MCDIETLTVTALTDMRITYSWVINDYLNRITYFAWGIPLLFGHKPPSVCE